MTRYGRIYIIKNTVSDKVYVGQTKVSLKLRFQNHLSAARNGKDYIIGKAIRKYGEDKFYIELLEECTVEELNEREKYWIASLILRIIDLVIISLLVVMLLEPLKN